MNYLKPGDPLEIGESTIQWHVDEERLKEINENCKILYLSSDPITMIILRKLGTDDGAEKVLSYYSDYCFEPGVIISPDGNHSLIKNELHYINRERGLLLLINDFVPEDGTLVNRYSQDIAKAVSNNFDIK